MRVLLHVQILSSGITIEEYCHDFKGGPLWDCVLLGGDKLIKHAADVAQHSPILIPNDQDSISFVFHLHIHFKFHKIL